jgi:thiamine biosynthesis lipoprotein
VEGVKQIAVVTTNGSIGEILSTSLFAADSEQRKALLAESSSVLNRFFFIGY